jgi:hypothetical protein
MGLDYDDGAMDGVKIANRSRSIHIGDEQMMIDRGKVRFMSKDHSLAVIQKSASLLRRMLGGSKSTNERSHQEIGAALIWPDGVYKSRADLEKMFKHSKAV